MLLLVAVPTAALAKLSLRKGLINGADGWSDPATNPRGERERYANWDTAREREKTKNAEESKRE